MRTFIIAAGLAAILGGATLNGAARADDFSGPGAHPRDSAAANPLGTAPYAGPSADARGVLPPVTTGTALDPFGTTTRSHGHP